MKGLSILYVLAIVIAAQNIFAQGTVNFAARVVGEYDAPVYVGCLGKAEGRAYLVQLYAGPDANSLAATGDPVPFRTGADAGHWSAATRIIPTVPPGASAVVQIRAWLASH